MEILDALDISQVDVVRRRREALQALLVGIEHDDYLHVTSNGLVNDCHTENDLTAAELSDCLGSCAYVLLEGLEKERFCSFHVTEAYALSYCGDGDVIWTPLWLLDLDRRIATPLRLQAVLDAGRIRC